MLSLSLLFQSRYSSFIVVNSQGARRKGKDDCIPYSNSRIFSSRNVQTGLGIPLAFCVAGAVAHYAGVKRQEREANHSNVMLSLVVLSSPIAVAVRSKA
jgi:hypothetical protein